MGIALSAASRKILLGAQACQRNYDGEVWKNRDLAEAAGRSEKTVERCLSGKNVSKKTVSTIAHALGVVDRIPELNPEPTTIPESSTPPPVVELARNNLDRHRRDIPEFVGRDDALAELDQLFSTTDRVAVTAVSGLGGLGKTELALRWADRQLETGRYPGGICWLDVMGGRLDDQIVTFCEIFFDRTISEFGKTPQDRLQLCWAKWESWQPGTVLLILDDVERQHYRRDIQPFLPRSPKFQVLMTTRDRDWVGMQELELDVLPPRAALRLLISYVGRDRVAAEAWAVRRLVRWLGYLPLGVELAGRYLYRSPYLVVTDYQQELEQRQLEHESLDQPADLSDYPRGVAAAIEQSWRQLSQDAQCMAMWLSLHARALIPLEVDWVTDQSEKRAAGSALAALQQLSLLEEVSELDDSKWRKWGRKFFRLHPLVHEFFWGKLTGFQCRSAELMAGLAAEESWSKAESEARSREVLAQIREPYGIRPGAIVRSFVELWQGRLAQLPEKPESRDELEGLHYWGVHFEVLIGDRQGLQFRSWFGHQQWFSCLYILGNAYYFLGNYDRAEPYWKRRLADHPSTATSLNNLANLYRSQGKYESAEPLYQRALDIRERQLGADHPDTATSLNNLAGLYDSQGKYESAEPLYQRALDIWERQLGADHPSTATSLNNLAALYHSQGKYESAEPLYQRALDIYERQLGADHPDTANSLHNLALLYQSQGKYELAEPLFLRACSILIQTQNVTLQYIGTNVLRFYQIALPAGLPDTTLRNHPLADLILPHLQTPPDTQ